MTTTIANASMTPSVWTRGTLFSRAALVGGLGLSLTAIGLQVGTGGASTASYYLDRGTKGYAVASYNVAPTIERVSEAATPGENLARIRAVLKPTMTELARSLKVSRQAIYDWQSGASIKAEHAEKLADLAHAAEIFAKKGLTTTHQILRRQIAGQSFFDKVRDGESAESAARFLLKIVRREHEQRLALEQRLKDRPRRGISADDIGTQHVSEQG